MKVLIKLLLAILLITPAAAFAASDYLGDLDYVMYWDEPRNITVWVQPHKYQNIAYDAFRAWMKASNGCVRFVDAPSEHNANINVYFIDTNYLHGGNAVGTTTYYHNSPTIKIAVSRYSRIEIESVLLHEIGHALGMQGHSRDIKSIMYPTTASAAGRRLTNKDEATIQKMYCGR